MAGVAPYGKLKYKDVKGSRMAYVDEGQEIGRASCRERVCAIV